MLAKSARAGYGQNGVLLWQIAESEREPRWPTGRNIPMAAPASPVGKMSKDLPGAIRLKPAKERSEHRNA
eukprot:15440918-Alexandrium_andersonii.AAC.1